MRAFYQGWEVRQTPSATFEAMVTGSLFSSLSGLENSRRYRLRFSWPTFRTLGGRRRHCWQQSN